MKIDRISVESDNLASVKYDHLTSMLEIEFNKGGIYQYYDVPEYIYEGLMNAASKGGYFHQYVRNAGFSYSKIG